VNVSTVTWRQGFVLQHGDTSANDCAVINQGAYNTCSVC
jgi:hypothetical protein